MRRSWLTLTLIALPLLPGCFDAHTAGNAGPPPPPPEDSGLIMPPPPPVDGGGAVCAPYDASVLELRCEAPSDPSGVAAASVTTAPTVCCESGAVSARATRTSDSVFDIGLAWTACSCCADCRCLGPISEVRLELGVLAPGTYTVRAGGQSCELVVPDVVSDCRRATPDQVRVPQDVLAGLPVPLTLYQATASSCSCEPRLVVDGTTGRIGANMDLCGCCDACECIDRGYESSGWLEPLPAGDHLLVRALGTHPITAHDPGTCREIEPLSVEIYEPSTELRTSGPRLHWLHVTGEEFVCCGPAAGVLEPLLTGEAGTAFALRSCLVEDCDCRPGAPTIFDAWYAIADLPPGEHPVRVGGTRLSISVP